MTRINTYLSDGEIILYRNRKKKWYIPFMIISCPFWMLTAFLFIIPCYQNMFLGAISFDSKDIYMTAIFGLFLFIPQAVLMPMRYIFNQFVITDQRIYIRKGLSGALHIINHSDIYAYEHVHQNIKGVSSHFIRVYLKSGKHIFSGSLYIKDKDVAELTGIMNSKIDNIVSTRKQYKAIRLNKIEACNNEIRRNLLHPIISYSPFVIGLIMLLLYFTGVNKVGDQIDIQIYGIVENKSINYDDGKVSGYDFDIIEDEGNQKYDFTVDAKIYSMFEEGDKILIKAKKGTLGIVYDQCFYMQ